MDNNGELQIIHIVWQGPLSVQEASCATTNDDCGIYQIYGGHDVSGPDTLLYIGQADGGPFSNRIQFHFSDWGRWNPDEVSAYLGRLAGLKPITNEEWGVLIDRAEAILIWKIGLPFNSTRIKRLPDRYLDRPILVINHGRRHRIPEAICKVTEFINTDNPQFRKFGLSGHPSSDHPDAPPTSPPSSPSEQQ